MMNHKIPNKAQIALEFALALSQGTTDFYQDGLFKNASPQPHRKECLCMPVTLDFNKTSSTGNTPSDTINRLIDKQQFSF